MDLKKEARLKRKKRIRKKILGTQERPRLSVFRSSRHIYAQVIDDISGRTLASASSVETLVKEQFTQISKKRAAADPEEGKDTESAKESKAATDEKGSKTAKGSKATKGGKGKSPLALGIRNDSIELQVKMKTKEDREQVTIKFPE